MSRMPYVQWKEQVLDGVCAEFGISREVLEETGLPELWQAGYTVEDALDEITREVLAQAHRDYQEKSRS